MQWLSVSSPLPLQLVRRLLHTREKFVDKCPIWKTSPSNYNREKWGCLGRLFLPHHPLAGSLLPSMLALSLCKQNSVEGNQNWFFNNYFLIYFRSTIRNQNVANTPNFYDSIDTVNEPEPKGPNMRKIQQSKHLPNWIWVIITSVLGIGHSKKYLATIIYMFTLLSALVFTFLGVMFVVYDVASKHSRTTVHIGAISLLLGFAWLCLGIYSFRLAGRLFGNEDFAASIRSHSRTLFKINSAVLLVTSGFAFTGLSSYSFKINFILGTVYM